jgi:4'-phosphopantetheinyl transferase EntD
MQQSSSKRRAPALWHSVKCMSVIDPKNPAVLSAGLQSLFPNGARVAELRGPGDPALLYPDEAVHLGRAVLKRVQEFAAGRLCARRVLAEFGIHDFPVKAAEDRQPLWPADLVGSITHTAGFCAVVAAEKSRVAAIGIDSEQAESVTPDLWRGICVQGEIGWLSAIPQTQQAAAATLIFAAKEAFYKCQYPSVGERLGFQDVAVEVRAFGEARGVFRIHANRILAFARQTPMPIEGHYLFHEQFISAAVAVSTASLNR